MPVRQTMEVPAENVAKGDLLNGHEVDAVKVGRKWVDLTGLTGHRIDRVELGTKLTVQRDFPTDEEKEAEKRALWQRYLERAEENLQEELAATLAATPQDALRELAEKEEGYRLLDSWSVGRLLRHQAQYDFATRVQGLLDRWAENGMTEIAASLNVPPTVLAYAFITRSAREQNVSDPLSRSTSTLSNLLDDLNLHVAQEGGSSLNRMVINAVVRQLEQTRDDSWF